MAAKPTEDFKWATSTVEETVINQTTGLPTQVFNKEDIDASFEASGSLASQPFPRPYMNRALNHLGEWQQHLDQRYAVGDVHITASAESVGDISIRLGGTWVLRGTDTIAAQLYNVYEKTV